MLSVAIDIKAMCRTRQKLLVFFPALHLNYDNCIIASLSGCTASTSATAAEKVTFLTSLYTIVMRMKAMDRDGSASLVFYTFTFDAINSS